MDETREDMITTSNNDIAVEDIVREHCYVEIKSKTVLFYHLSDHNYFETESQKPKKKSAKQMKKREGNIKITDLRALYNCKSCGYRTMDRDRILFSQHKCNSKPARYVPCTICDRNKAPAGYQQCTKCSYFTKKQAGLKVHMRIHSQGTPYKCTECDYSGKDLKELISHYNKVKDLICECGYTTHFRQQMVAHTRTHTGEKPFLCGVCNYSFSDRIGLHRHLKKHHV